jgi:uncharacterized protein YecA (UPF0149 family)
MDTRNGSILTPEEYTEALKIWNKKESRFLKEMLLDPTPKQMARRPPKVGRNDPCPCGSGKKFKKCCLNSIK